MREIEIPPNLLTSSPLRGDLQLDLMDSAYARLLPLRSALIGLRSYGCEKTNWACQPHNKSEERSSDYRELKS